jgi:hypothetical protein
MTRKQRLLAGVFTTLLMAMASAFSQNFPAKGNDSTTSLGSFKIGVVTQFQQLFAGCPAFDPKSGILQSPTLFDPATIIGRSDVITDGSQADYMGVPVGSANTNVSEMMLSAPPQWSCFDETPCSSGPGTREVHTEVRSLNMTASTPGGTIAVRAGTAYPAPDNSPIRVSPGEVESHSGPAGGPDFPASSYFDVFVKVDLPACGNFPASTVLNNAPIIVKNKHLTQFPPKVAYLHDSSTIVPVVFLGPSPYAGQILGYFLLAGHGVGYGNSQSDMDDFNNIMSGQTTGICPNHACDPPPAPAPSPTPVPQPSPTPIPQL